MKHLRDRVNVPRTAELELAEEAARRAVEKIFGGASGPSSFQRRVRPVARPTDHGEQDPCSKAHGPSLNRHAAFTR
jgi:hypothetical protein